MNPLRAGLVSRPQTWLWSSARAHLAGQDDGIVMVAPLLDRSSDFAQFLEAEEDQAAVEAMRRSRSTGRPVGGSDWIKDLATRIRRRVAPGKRGPRAATDKNQDQGDLFHTASP